MIHLDTWMKQFKYADIFLLQEKKIKRFSEDRHKNFLLCA